MEQVSITQLTVKASIQVFQSNLSIIDSFLFLAALAWNAVKSVTLRIGWRKLCPSVMLRNGSSDDEDLKELNIRPRQTVKWSLETMTAEPTDDPITKLQENEIEEWIQTDKEVEVTELLQINNRQFNKSRKVKSC